MSDGNGEEDTPHHELVIIRRRHEDDAPHHGGVWKIAHADFMTALMAFFLVMWLINATDEQTVSGVANYFNPMRLSDSSTKPKGVFNMDPGASHDSGKEGEPEGADKQSKSRAKKAEDKRKSAEATMLSEPYEALDKIAAEVGKTPPVLALTERGNTPAHKTGEAFRDPFDPDLRYEAPHPGEARGKDGSGAASGKEAAGKEAPGQGKADGGDAPGSYPRIDDAAEKARADMQRRIEEVVRQSGLLAIPGIEVRVTGEGLLISITDQSNFEMFGLSSARPKPELVVLMEKLGKIIMARPEQVVIRGHTDARPFRSGDYDNWRLSTARAHMAYYMLTRGGVPDKRFDRIEGRADHDPRVPGEPLAPANRRIEVLLLKGRT